jgi:RimJ/RimL family protein N-acetyltransferase
MGVDRARLGTAHDVKTKYLNAIRTGDPEQSSIALGVTLTERLVGYTLLNRYSADVNISHWHLIVPGARGNGLSTALYARRVQAYFAMAPITRLIHQTRASNQGMNRVLSKFVPVAETRYEEKPDGVASPGEFNIRYVLREDVPRILARAVALGILPEE